MSKKKSIKNNKRKKRFIRKETFFTFFFLGSLFIYIVSSIGLKSYNITLQAEEQELSAQVDKKKEAVNELETEVNNLQNKTRLLGMLDSSVKDNQNNIYILED